MKWKEEKKKGCWDREGETHFVVGFSGPSGVNLFLIALLVRVGSFFEKKKDERNIDGGEGWNV